MVQSFCRDFFYPLNSVFLLLKSNHNLNIMKMGIGIGLFIGILFILAGVSIIIRILFNIDIPVFKLVVAFIFLYIGIRLLTGDFSARHIRSGENAVIFGEAQFQGLPDDHEYTILFGSARIDLTQVADPNKIQNLKINTIFGGSELIIRKDQPVRITAEAAFASARLPGNKETSFGKVTYQPDSLSPNTFLEVESNVVFGEFKVYVRD